MAEQVQNPAPAPAAPAAAAAAKMTAAAAAALVFRESTRIVTGEDGQPETVTERVKVTPEEVLAFRDYGAHVVVVTTDGQKLTGKKGK